MILKRILLEKKEVKLNLGCCGKKDIGWINIDIDKKVRPDIVDDVITLNKFENDSVDEIKSAHLLEHLLEKDAIRALKTWYKILKPGGILSIECPNIDKCIKMIQSQSDNEEEKKLGFVGLFGDPSAIKKYGIYHAHKYGWNPKKLIEILTSIGFTDTKEVEIEETYRCANQKYDRDMRILAIKQR